MMMMMMMIVTVMMKSSGLRGEAVKPVFRFRDAVLVSVLTL